MLSWYESDEFRGHVREPDVNDLLYIARDMKLKSIKIMGRNWLGYKNTNNLIRVVTPIVDYVLRINPRLCSDIYLIGFKDKMTIEKL